MEQDASATRNMAQNVMDVKRERRRPNLFEMQILKQTQRCNHNCEDILICNHTDH